MIRKPNFKLNWKYALGEIVLIFIGISLAVAFQNYNENQKAAQFEKGILEEILGSLTLDIQELYQIQIANENAETSIEKTLNYAENGGTQAQRDSVPVWLGKFMSFERFNPSTSTYEVLKSEGLQSISNRGLRHLIAEYYDEAIPNIVQSLIDVEDDFERNMIELVKKEFKEYKYKEIAVPKDLNAFLSNQENIVYMKIFRDNRDGSFDGIRAGIELNKNIIKMISQEIYE